MHVGNWGRMIYTAIHCMDTWLTIPMTRVEKVGYRQAWMAPQKVFNIRQYTCKCTWDTWLYFSYEVGRWMATVTCIWKKRLLVYFSSYTPSGVESTFETSIMSGELCVAKRRRKNRSDRRHSYTVSARVIDDKVVVRSSNNYGIVRWSMLHVAI